MPGSILNPGDETTGKSVAENVRLIHELNPARATAPAPEKPKTASVDKINPKAKYGDKPPEKRMDVTDALKPLGTFHKGTPYVPKTGNYRLEKGEAVTSKENNMNATEAMSGITGKQSKPEKKIHKITTHKSDDGKLIHTHIHHHPSHHPDETHISNNIGEAQDHMAAMEPQMSAQAPPMPEPGAPAAGAPAGM